MSLVPNSLHDWIAEWDYRYTERLSMLCGTATPTEREKDIASNDADEAIKALKEWHLQQSAENRKK